MTFDKTIIPKAKSKNERILNEFIEREMCNSMIGAGDDLYYANQIVDYINKQRKLWLEYTKFVLKQNRKAKA
jgi:hypothetical protein